MRRLLCVVATLPLLLNVGCVTAEGRDDETYNSLQTKSQVVNTDYDGTYNFGVSCKWEGYGSGRIGDGSMWKIEDGILNHKSRLLRTKGTVEGNKLVITGDRYASNAKVWSSVYLTVNLSTSKVNGTWRGGQCKGSFDQVSVAKVSGDTKTYIIDGARDYFLIADAINRKPINDTKVKLEIVLQYPDVSKDKYPLVVIVASSQGFNYEDEILMAQDFRKLGYATLLVDSYTRRGVGGDSAEVGYTINTPTIALDALYALDAVKDNPRIDMNRTALYGASKGSLATEETMIIALGRGLPMFKVLLSENSNMCFDWSKVPLHRNVKLVVFTGGKDDSGTLSECVERTNIFKSKGYNITHINYPNSAHRFVITQARSGTLPKQVDGYGYSRCEWLVDTNGNQGYRNKSTDVVTFPQNRIEMKGTIRSCLNRGIFWGGTVAERNQFFADAHNEMQKVFSN